jgi:hypothetical protein
MSRASVGPRAQALDQDIRKVARDERTLFLVVLAGNPIVMLNVSTNGTSLYVRVRGKGPAVVLLHGFGDTGDMWAPLAAGRDCPRISLEDSSIIANP